MRCARCVEPLKRGDQLSLDKSLRPELCAACAQQDDVRSMLARLDPAPALALDDDGWPYWCYDELLLSDDDADFVADLWARAVPISGNLDAYEFRRLCRISTKLSQPCPPRVLRTTRAR